MPGRVTGGPASRRYETVISVRRLTGRAEHEDRRDRRHGPDRLEDRRHPARPKAQQITQAARSTAEM
jgi:hypothetical protein